MKKEQGVGSRFQLFLLVAVIVGILSGAVVGIGAETNGGQIILPAAHGDYAAARPLSFLDAAILGLVEGAPNICR